MRRILHLTGSPTDGLYAELSRLYAADCLAATADPRRYEILVADVQPGGAWRFPATLAPADLAAAPPLGLAAAIERITQWQPDAVVPQLFCRMGMTSYRALFDLLSVPVIGNSATVMALGADKAAARALVAAAGVDVPEGVVLRAAESDRRPERLPVVVKPVSADNSFGVSLVRSMDQWPAALASAFEHDDTALVEAFVPLGREVRCGVLDRDGQLVALPLEEYAVDAIRTPGDKLRRGESDDLQLVAKQTSLAWIVDPADPVTAAVHEAARRAFTALGCRQYGLFDFRVDPAGRPWFLEAGLYCSFARQSVVVAMAEAAGIPLSELFEECVAAAIRSAAP